MSKRIKKIIAREFLILLASSIVLFLIVFIWEFGHEKHNSDRRKLVSELTRLYKQDSIPAQLGELIEYLEGKDSGLDYQVVKGEFNSLKEIDDSLLNQYVDYARGNKEGWIFINRKFPELGFDSDGFLKNSPNYSLLKKINENINRADNSFFKNRADQELVVIIIIIIVYGFRYLYYMTIWSIKQLKS